MGHDYDNVSDERLAGKLWFIIACLYAQLGTDVQ